jgi:hypothetical protein
MQLQGMTVNDTGNNAFSAKSIVNSGVEEKYYIKYLLTSVTIPNTVTSIGENAFYGHPLIKIVIGVNVIIRDTSFRRGHWFYVDYNFYGFYNVSCPR